MGQEFNFSRTLAAALIASTIYSLLSAVVALVMVLLRKIAYSTFYSSGTAIQIAVIFLMGLIFMAGLFIFMNSRYGGAEAAMSAVEFFGLSIVMVPIAVGIVLITLSSVFHYY